MTTNQCCTYKTNRIPTHQHPGHRVQAALGLRGMGVAALECVAAHGHAIELTCDDMGRGTILGASVANYARNPPIPAVFTTKILHVIERNTM